MSDVTLGQLIEGEPMRDAIHIAIAPIVASEALIVGDHVGLNAKGEADTEAPHIGIVDPFLKKRVSKGDKFWLCLYQKTVTGMRHHWSHPAFMDTKPQGEICGESRKWIAEFAAMHDLTSDQIIEAASRYIDLGEYFMHPDDSGRLEGEVIPDEFWIHFAAITGKKGEGHFFTCSC
jgi:hypothetical protein